MYYHLPSIALVLLLLLTSPSTTAVPTNNYLSHWFKLVKTPNVDVNEVEDTIELHPDVVNAQDPDNAMTALLYATNNVHVELARLLLRKGANAMLEEKGGYYVWDIVAFTGQNLELANLFMEYKITPNVEHKDGFRPIHRVCWGSTEGHAQILARLLSSKLSSVNDIAGDGSTPLKAAMAMKTRFKPIITILLHAGADKSVLTSDQLEEIKELIDEAEKSISKHGPAGKAKTDPVSPPLTTPQEDLARGVRRDDVKLVASALERGANINHREKAGNMQTPLMSACLMGNHRVVRLLLEHKADATLGEEDGFTPFHGAAYQGRPEVAKVLIEYGLDPASFHTDGFTPFHRALWGVTDRHTEFVHLLLEKGLVNPSLKTKSGDTPLQLVLKTSRNFNTARVLRQFNSDASGLSEMEQATLFGDVQPLRGKPLAKDDPLRNDPMIQAFEGIGLEEL